jgi:hypothetical protein
VRSQYSIKPISSERPRDGGGGGQITFAIVRVTRATKMRRNLKIPAVASRPNQDYKTLAPLHDQINLCDE